MRRRLRLVKSREYSPSERSIQDSICCWLTIQGVEHSVTDASLPFVNGKPRRGRVKPGWPDVSGVMPAHSTEPGRALFVEVKAARGRLRPKQIEVITRLRESGARVVVAYSPQQLIDELGPLLEQKKAA